MKVKFKNDSIFDVFKRHWFRLKMRRATPNGLAELMRDKFYYLGKNVELYTLDFGTEPWLISIHDNAVCAAGVKFINHDISVHRLAYSLGLKRGEIGKLGSIELFENCFVGHSSILMPNCSVGRNSIIAAGSIVTKHVPDNEVWGGIPAKFIMTVDEYTQKMLKQSAQYPWMPLEKKNSMPKDEFIRCCQQYFFEK